MAFKEAFAAFAPTVNRTKAKERRRSMEPETKFAKSGELFIAYPVVGAGPLDLVFAPAYSSHLELNWEWPPYQDSLCTLEKGPPPERTLQVVILGEPSKDDVHGSRRCRLIRRWNDSAWHDPGT